MDIAILGAGALGGYLGGRLVEAGQPVTFVVREGRAKQLEAKLAITSPRGNAVIQNPVLVTDPSEIEQCDLVILGVKGYHLEGALPTLDTLVDKGAHVLPLLNGLEHYPILEERYGKERVLGGLAHIIVTLDADGQVLHSSQLQRYTFGPLHPSQEPLCREFASICEPAIVDVVYSEQILEEIWKKYAFITAYSGVTAASRQPVGPLLDTPPLRQLFLDTLQEMIDLAAAHGVEIETSYPDTVLAVCSGFDTGNTSSLHQDLRKDQKLEVEHLHGGALRLASEVDMELPRVATLYALLKPYEHGPVEA